MRLLITGGAGFIGSNFVRYMLGEHRDVEIVNLDALTYAGNLENLADIEKDQRYTFVKGDIASEPEVQAVFKAHAFDAVVNFAAESHVDRSLHLGADAFIRTNVLGTQLLLDAARAHKVRRYVQVSTDEVYGSLGPDGSFTEETPVAPNNPYSATKAAADFLVRAAWHSHGLDAVTTRCSNNFGPFQFPEKMIPLMIANAMEDKPLPVYGDGLHVRDWIYVVDHCRALDVVLRKGRTGEVYNIGGLHDVPNLEVVKLLLSKLGKPESLIKFVKDRPGHDRRYAMDAGKIRKELGWQPAYTFEQAIGETIEWYRAHREWLDHVRSGRYAEYYEKMYAGR
ncbi:MAG: dTDP-glucose 4,6-dehydratase [Kiritimatiellae bacterium]|nr:dTDP-glucose 4,6-dehydratase [Kiritimatiellia bacterium]